MLLSFYVLQYFVPSIVMVYDPFFYRFSDADKKEYYVRIISSVHGVIAGPIAVYMLIYACDKPGETIFSDLECTNNVKPMYVYLILFSTAYIFADMHWTLNVFQYKGAELAEYMWHHACVFLATSSSFFFGGFAITLSALVLVVELSNVFMNVRWFMQKHRATEHWFFMPCCFLFLVLFFITRIVYLLMLVVRSIEIQLTLIDVRKLHGDNMWKLMQVNNVGAIALYLLQLWWFVAIMKVVVNTLAGGDVNKSQVNAVSDKDDDKKKT